MRIVRTTLGPRGRNTVTVARRRALTFFPMGDDITTPTVTDPLAEIRTNTIKLLALQEEEARSRRLALYVAAASALFAAAKLGIIAIPHIRSRFRPSE